MESIKIWGYSLTVCVRNRNLNEEKSHPFQRKTPLWLSPLLISSLVIQVLCLQCVLKLNKDREPQLRGTHIYTIFLYLTCYNPFQIKSPIMLVCSASYIYVPKPQNCVSPAGFICTTQLSLHSRCKPVCQWPAQNYDPEGAGATLLPVWTHHHLPHPRGSGHRYPWGSASFFLAPLRWHAC